MTIQHTVSFRLAHEPDTAEETAFLDDAARILTSIPGVTAFAIKRQVSPKSDHRWQFTMVFSDQASYDAYNAHPAHVAFVNDRWLTEVAAFQELDLVAR